MFEFGTGIIVRSLKKARILSKRLGVVAKIAPIRMNKNPAERRLKRFSVCLCENPLKFSFNFLPNCIYLWDRAYNTFLMLRAHAI